MSPLLGAGWHSPPRKWAVRFKGLRPHVHEAKSACLGYEVLHLRCAVAAGGGLKDAPDGGVGVVHLGLLLRGEPGL
jgi:hypothetical protein